MPTPDTFERSLKAYDPLLTLRWGSHVNAWVIDRKGRVSEALWRVLLWCEQQPDCEPLERERVVSAKLGCRPVLHTKVLGQHVFDELWKDDLQVHGTKVVDRHMHRLEQERNRKRNDDTGSRRAAEAMDFINRRRADPTPEQQRKVFEEVVGRELTPTQSRRKFNKSLLDHRGKPVQGEPEKKIQIVVP